MGNHFLQNGVPQSLFNWLVYRLHFRNRYDADALFIAAFPLEGNGSVYLGEEGVITAHSDVFSRMNIRAGLSHQDVTSPYQLARETLYS